MNQQGNLKCKSITAKSHDGLYSKLNEWLKKNNTIKKDRDLFTVTYIKDDSTEKQKVISWKLVKEWKKFSEPLIASGQKITEAQFKEWYAIQPKTTNQKYYLHGRLKKKHPEISLNTKDKTFYVLFNKISEVSENIYVQRLRSQFDYQIQTCIPQ